MADSRRQLSTITAAEWMIRWQWVEVTRNCDPERMFVPAGLRTPYEAARAKADVEAIGWDALREDSLDAAIAERAEAEAAARGETPLAWEDVRRELDRDV